MKLIICEKDIAARRIAKILFGKVERTKFGYKYGDVIIFGLKGHILDIDFPRSLKDWNVPLNKLADSNFRIVVKDFDRYNTLKKLAKHVSEVIIATDYDREGEAIGLEALNIIKSVNAKVKVKRARFSAITKEEIKKAFQNLTTVDIKLANAAFARREIDLLWGAILTRYISNKLNRRWKEFLSAGRVQTPTLRLIVEREKEIKNFKPQIYYSIKADFGRFTAYGKASKKPNFGSEEEAKVEKFERFQRKFLQPLPFNTTSFLAEAGKLGFKPHEAMKIAEELYMRGYISYPRTDNTSLDKVNVKAVAKMLYPYYKYRPAFKIRKGNEKKDHPPIHPTSPPKNLKGNWFQIYDIIARRFLASISEPALVLEKRVVFDVKGYKLKANGVEIIKKGWLQIYGQLKEVKIPDLNVGQKLIAKITVKREQTKPPPRYSSSTIIKKMESLGLGTKSTRAEILRKLLLRKYINENFIPSKDAFIVIEMLKDKAEKITSPELTAKLEEKLKEIEEGKIGKDELLRMVRNEIKEVLSKLLL